MRNLTSRRQILSSVIGLPLVLGSAKAWAQAGSAGDGLLARLQAAKTVTVGTANFPPYSGVNLDGSLTGIAPALTEAVMRRLGVPNVKGVAATYGELIPGMMAGRWDFISTALTITKARCGQVLFADPIVFDGASIISLKGQFKDPPKLIAQIAARKLIVGVSTGGALSRIARAAGVSPDNIREIPDNVGLIDALVARQIQVVLQDHAGIQRVYVQRNLAVDATFPVADAPANRSSCAFRKTNVDLYAAFQKELRAIKASGEYLTIARKYGFDTLPGDLSITAEEACKSSV